jgi:hypothetical protein
MKRVMQTVLSEVELRAVKSRGERARRSAIAFSPNQQGLVVVARRTPRAAGAPQDADGGHPRGAWQRGVQAAATTTT